ncbi:hypothetical protein A5790_02570 [Mycobacterium sp. 852002-51152_SCH6134967]|nr:hypothetical protein A5790_02570 [Mycobacterium sp. 852002-51152_SCH6134967]
MAAGLLGAALVTGNTVVHKPSERCPATGRRFAQLLAEQLPDGVLEILDGDGSVGGQLASAPDVDVVAHGSFYPPTVLADCTPEMLVFSEETFGPVAPVRVVPDFDTALREAADDRYGLAATVLTADMGHAQEAWRALPVGTVKINDVFGGAPGGASQPRRASGNGFGFGPELLDEMTAMKVVHISPPNTWGTLARPTSQRNILPGPSCQHHLRCPPHSEKFAPSDFFADRWALRRPSPREGKGPLQVRARGHRSAAPRGVSGPNPPCGSTGPAPRDRGPAAPRSSAG